MSPQELNLFVAAAANALYETLPPERLAVLAAAIFSAGSPCCRRPKKSPGPRSFRSSSAILNPSPVWVMTFKRARVSSFRLSEINMQ